MARLIFDSSCFRGCSQATVRELHKRGHLISVSQIALHEVWANAVRNDDVARFRSRLRNLAGFINARDPVVPTGIQLLARLGARLGGTQFVEPDRRYESKIRLLWKHLVDGTIPESAVQLGGNLADADIAELAAEWSSPERDLSPEHEDAVRHVPRDIAVPQIATHLAKCWASDISLRLGVHERLHAYFRYVALFAHQRIAAPNFKQEDNDSEDVQLLMHLADDVILVTTDLNLVTRIDLTASFQAPYVRTPAELLLSTVPVGPPWGRTARRASKTHLRRERAQLVKLDQDLAGRLQTAS